MNFNKSHRPAPSRYTLGDTKVRNFHIILIIFLSTFFSNCTQQSNKPKIGKDLVEDISVDSYLFITDTAQIRKLIGSKVNPYGYPFDVNKMVNHFVKISLTNNWSDTIFLSKIYTDNSPSMDSLILSQCLVRRFSNDSITWQQPSEISDNFNAFDQPLLSKETTNRFLYIDNLNDARYFEFGILYRRDSLIKEKTIIVRL